jgi:hypothetical protein
MKQWRRYPTIGLVLLGVALPAAGCGGSSGGDSAEPAAIVEDVAGTETSRVTLSPEAAKRLDIQTAVVKQRAGGTVVPYAAVFYSPSGDTWAYVSTRPRSFVRERIVVDRVEGDQALLSKGPAVGTKVATVGVAELFGAESGIDQ